LERAVPTSGPPEQPPPPAVAPVAEPSLNGTPLDDIPEALPVEEPLPPPAPEPPLVRVLLSPTPSRRLAESLIIFVSAILYLRAIAVEPFGVPTGSMAPTLIGNHKCANCPRCGYVIRVGEPSRPHAGLPHVTCPNCGQPDIDVNSAPDIAGDRLLVDKNVYTLRRPRRWEPAVFRCPSDLTKPYVKRVIALPGESVFVADGDIYINGKLARKTLAEAREMRVPVYDMNFPPQPGGWVKRWSIENNLPAGQGEPAAASAFALREREFHLDGTKFPQETILAAYRHHRYDETAGGEVEEVLRDTFVYNAFSGEDKTQPVHDFFLEFEVEIVGGSGQLLCRMSDGRDQLTASCPVNTADDTRLRHEGLGVFRAVPRKPMQVGKKYRVEMAFVDRRVSIAVDGTELFAAYDLEAAKDRADVTAPFAIGVQGASVVVRDLRLYRDIHYRSSGKNGVDEPYTLAGNEYFMMGDNSANSDDSRSWPIPGVPERNFLGKPFLLHQPSKVSHLTAGGRERVFQSIDWSRIRFLR
jgi:signal peptidase I